MDKLTDLPPVENSSKTPEEAQILNQFFGGASDVGDDDTLDSVPQKPKMNWKMIGVSVLLFALLANPWIDSVLCKLPKCESTSTIFILKIVVYIILVMCAAYFL